MNRFVKIEVKNCYELSPYDIVLPVKNPKEDKALEREFCDSEESEDDDPIYEPAIPKELFDGAPFSSVFRVGRHYDIRDYLDWSKINDPVGHRRELEWFKSEAKHGAFFETEKKGVFFLPLRKAWYRGHSKKPDKVSPTEKDFVKDLTNEGIEPNPGPNPRPRRTQRKERKNKSKQRTYRKQQRHNQSKRFAEPPTSQNIGSETCIGTLGYVPDFIGFNGANYGVKSFKMNDFYDVDPGILSTIIAGLKRYTDYYYQGLVLKHKIKLTVQNKRGTLIKCYLIVSIDALDTVIATHQQAKDVCENSMLSEMRQEVAVGTYPDTKTTFKPTYLPNMTKKGAYLNSEIYNCLYNASPVYPFYINIVAFSIDSSDPLDLIFDMSMEFRILFMEFRLQDDNGPIFATPKYTPRVNDEFTSAQLKIYDQNRQNWKYSRKDLKFKDVPKRISKESDAGK